MKALAIAMYMVVATSLVTTNKWLLQRGDVVGMLLLVQFVGGAALLGGAMALKPSLWEYDAAELRQWMPCSVFFGVLMAVSLYNYEHNELSNILVFKTTTPLLTYVLERLLWPEHHLSTAQTARHLLCLFGTVGGIALYAETVPSTMDGWQLCILLVNVGMMSAETLYRRAVLQRVTLPKHVLVFWLNVWNALVVVCWVLVRRERPSMLFRDARSFTAVAFSVVWGLAIGWVGVWLQSNVSATLFLCCGNLNKVLLLLIAVLAFDDAVTPSAVVGWLLALGCSAAFVLARMGEESDVVEDENEKIAEGAELIERGTPGT